VAQKTPKVGKGGKKPQSPRFNPRRNPPFLRGFPPKPWALKVKPKKGVKKSPWPKDFKGEKMKG